MQDFNDIFQENWGIYQNSYIWEKSDLSFVTYYARFLLSANGWQLSITTTRLETFTTRNFRKFWFDSRKFIKMKIPFGLISPVYFFQISVFFLIVLNLYVLKSYSSFYWNHFINLRVSETTLIYMIQSCVLFLVRYVQTLKYTFTLSAEFSTIWLHLFFYRQLESD